MVPRLGALGEDVGLRPEPARVVESRDADPDDIRPGRDLDIERRAAIAAEHARDLVAAVGRGDIALRPPRGEADPGRGHPPRRDMRRPARPLAVAAMALQ